MGRLVISMLSATLSATINYCINKHVVSGNIIIYFNSLNAFVIVLGCISAFIVMVVKANLPDNLDYSYYSYKFQPLKEYIDTEDNKYKKFLAKLYIQNDKLLHIFAGWLLGFFVIHF